MHLHSKFLKSVTKSKNKFLLKYSLWVSKNAEFYADFESVHQTCFAYNFFLCTFKKLLQRIQNQREILRFIIHFFLFFQNKFVLYWRLLKALQPNAQKTAQKSKNVFSKYVLDYNFSPSKGLCSSFSKRKSNSLYPNIE